MQLQFITNDASTYFSLGAVRADWTDFKRGVHITVNVWISYPSVYNIIEE